MPCEFVTRYQPFEELGDYIFNVIRELWRKNAPLKSWYVKANPPGAISQIIEFNVEWKFDS